VSVGDISSHVAANSSIGDELMSQRGLLRSGIELTYSIFPAEFNADSDTEDTSAVNSTASTSGDEATTATVTAGSAEGAASFDMATLVALADSVETVTKSLAEIEIAGIPVSTASIQSEVQEATPVTCVPICKVCEHAAKCPVIVMFQLRCAGYEMEGACYM
jgi:hypothetical protein